MSALPQHTGRAPWHSAALATIALWLAAAVPAATAADPPSSPAPAAVESAPAAAPAASAAQSEALAPHEPLAPATPAPPRLSWFHRHRHPGQHAWVAAANPLAVEAGLTILARGGNAVDAAVAVQAMLGLVEPQSSGVGGGAFLLYYDAHSGHVTAWDGREKAPAGASPGMFLDEHGKPLPFVEAVRSGLSTGVPGAIAMLSAAQHAVGALRWKDLFEPAIRSATDGFMVSARLAMYLGEGSPFPPTNEVRMLFSQPDGETLEEGDLFRNPEYAHTLQLIAQQGPRALLEGQIAADIVKVTHQSPLPGTMTLKDLGSYRAESGDALCRPYRGYSVCVPPPPSSGVALLQMLAILDRTDIATRGPQDPQAWFLFAQASRLMYADRDRYVGRSALRAGTGGAHARSGLRAAAGAADRRSRRAASRARGDRAAARPRPDRRVARHEPLRRRGRRR